MGKLLEKQLVNAKQMPRVGFLRRMARMNFRPASMCWFGRLCGRPNWQAKDTVLPSQRCFQK